EHTGGLAAGAHYDVAQTFKLPGDLSGPYYVIVVTDPLQSVFDPHGQVEEANEKNNDLASPQQLLIDQQPPADLRVDTIVIPATAESGQPIKIQWTVSNHGTNAASGTWSDAVHLSSGTSWSITDIALGKVSFSGTLNPGDSYTSTLNAILPPTAPGS